MYVVLLVTHLPLCESVVESMGGFDVVTGSQDTASLYAVWTEVSSGTGLIVRS